MTAAAGANRELRRDKVSGVAGIMRPLSYGYTSIQGRFLFDSRGLW
jgi:hypothetical protein